MAWSAKDYLALLNLPATAAAVLGGTSPSKGAENVLGAGGQPEKNERIDLLRPEQIGLQNQSIQNALSMLTNMQNPQNRYEGFEPIAQQARTQFETKTVPGLAERFTALGGSYNRPGSASGLIGQLGSAGAGLEEGLASLKSQYGFQQQGQQQDLLRTLLGSGLGQGFENLYHPRQPGYAESALPYLLQILPKLLGA